MYYQNLLIFILFVGITIFLVWFFSYVHRLWLFKKIEYQKFPISYENILSKIEYYNKLNSKDKQKIHKSILIFINTKEFIGKGIDITDEIKVTIAFYACFLLLRLETKNCYDNLKTIIVYSHTVITKQVVNNGGIYSEKEMLISGQSANDTVVISWNDAKKEAYHISKDNVLVHEFAHEIDFLDGEIDGIPPLEPLKYKEWANVLYSDFKKLRSKALKNRYWGKYKILGSYAATNEAEFFAVATERFFGTPKALKQHFPELYNELKDFYKIDPLKL